MAYPVWALVVGSILTTVALVSVNKVIFDGGFPFVMTLSTLHFAATFLVTLFLSKGLGTFEPKFLPPLTNLLVAAAGVGSIAFMNYSLKFNSVGVYQMAKLTIIPVVLTYNALRGDFASRKVNATLVLVLFGVGVATVTDVQLSTVGLIFAAAAVLSTAQYQIWQGSKQREYSLTEMQLTMSVSSMQVIVGGVCAFFLEGNAVRETMFGTDRQMNAELLGKIIMSCLLAVSANVHSFALIGRTSPVTFQVVGHGKTCLILIAGYIMYPLPSTEEFLYNLSGVVLAVFGVILYSNLKMMEGKQADWCDMYAPRLLLDCIGSAPSVPQQSAKVDYAEVPSKDPEQPEGTMQRSSA